LDYLITARNFRTIEVDVPAVLDGSVEPSKRLAAQIDRFISSGDDVLLHTSRQLVVGESARQNLAINASVSAHLVGVISSLEMQPAVIIAKGGITANDLASRALSAERATVLGAVIPGVPVWELDHGSKFPGMPYVVFPGNVGSDQSLMEVFSIFKG
jgi:uncharacterized protein YgbK (DUF1537 family)